MAYKGTAYHGWQRQANSLSVQQVLEESLTQLNYTHAVVTGCGRTDTGVHASDFYAHVDLETAENADLAYALNAVLPADIAIKQVTPVDSESHARFDALSRTYTYRIHHQKDPFLIHQSLFHRKVLDIDAMNQAASHLIGRKEFTSFARHHGAQKTDFCDVREALWSREDGRSVFTITADRFLRNMVRAIVGTLLEVGTGKLVPEGFKLVLEAKERSAAGASAPAHGLYLSRVEYPYIDRDE
ncbi:MAG: tRNA pseudouridine(38-40) synthase TruA [Flavobacteriales bacterium]|nr:tRNA pseudouridine(38-40) synthase TruA [Flavobacteriales bacterium]